MRCYPDVDLHNHHFSGSSRYRYNSNSFAEQCAGVGPNVCAIEVSR
jgi:hypothetical protein